MTRHQNILVISHRRSGTHLTIDALSNNFASYDREYLNLDRLRETHGQPLSVDEIKQKLATGPHVIKTHMHGSVGDFFMNNTEHVDFVSELLDSSKLLYVHRDGRDVMVSLYYYMQGFKPDLHDSSFSDFLRSTNDQDVETLSDEISRPAFWAHHVGSWLDDDRVLTVSFELLRTDFERGLTHLGEVLGLKPPDSTKSVVRTEQVDTRSRSGVWKDRLQRLSTRFIRGQRSTAVSFRKGETGDYEGTLHSRRPAILWRRDRQHHESTRI